MSQPTADYSLREERADAAIAAYCKAVEEGKAPDQAAFLAAHPDVAVELEAFFADQARFHAVAQHVAAPQPPPVGAVVKYFGDYELLEVIAQGGMGVVYRARQTSLNREVALKMILAGSFASQDAVQRFHAEAESAAALDHPHIVPIYEVGDHQGQHYFSMKLIEGGSLSDWLKKTLTAEGAEGRGEKASPTAGVHILAQAARAVHHAHQRGILHRDLKPANILLDRHGQPHLTDFGLAKRLQSDTGATRSGAILGTPSYMAPEQAAGAKDITTLADVYSLGAILYELLTGRPPFQGESVFDVLQKVREATPEPPAKVNPAVDRDLEAVCLKCLAKEPSQRFATAEALAEDLEHWLAGEPLSVQPPSAARLAWQWLRRNVKAAVWLVLLSIAAGAIPTLSVSSAAMSYVLIRAREATLLFPHEGSSFLMRVDWEWLFGLLQSWWLMPLHLLGFLLLFSTGLLATRLVRSRNVLTDISTGLSTGLIAGMTACIVGMATAVLLTLTIVPQLTDLAATAEGCFRTEPAMGPVPQSPADRLLEKYPALRDQPLEKRGGVLFAKIVGDMVFGTFAGVWLGTLISLAAYVPSFMVQALAGGWLWRRYGTWRRVLLPYLELTGLIIPLGHAVTYFIVFGFFERDYSLLPGNLRLELLFLCGPLAVWLVLRGQPWWRRWSLYAAVLGPSLALDTLLTMGGWREQRGSWPVVLTGLTLSLLFLGILLWEWRRQNRRQQKAIVTAELPGTITLSGEKGTGS